MADKAPLLPGLHTRSLMLHFLVTIGTVIHSHAIRCEQGPSPDIAAVAGQTVLLVDFGRGGLSNLSVTGLAGQLCRLDVSGMGEKYAVGLPGVNMPGDVDLFFNIVMDEPFFVRSCFHHFPVTVTAGFDTGNTGKTTIRPESVTGFAALIGNSGVDSVIEIDGLTPAAVKQLGENDPAEKRQGDQAEGENQNRGAHGVFHLVVFTVDPCRSNTANRVP